MTEGRGCICYELTDGCGSSTLGRCGLELITRLLPLALLLVLRTRNNTDGNKLVIFSGIAWYYGDNYIIYSI